MPFTNDLLDNFTSADTDLTYGTPVITDHYADTGQRIVKSASTSVSSAYFANNRVYFPNASAALLGYVAHATADGVKVTAAVQVLSVLGSILVGARVTDDMNTGYFFGMTAGKLRVYRLNAGTFNNLFDVPYTPTVGAHTLSLTPTGVGSSVTLHCEIDGTPAFADYVDSDAARLVTLGNVGFYGDGAGVGMTATTGIHLDSVRRDVPAVADTTAPVMTGTLTSSGVSATGYTLDWSATTRSDNVAIGGYQHSVDGTTWTDSGNVTSRSFTGKAASTLYPNYVRAYDTATPPNYSTPALTLNVTTAAPSGDTTAPNLSGSITQGAVTSSSSAISYPAATDNVAVDHYEVSKDGGTAWINNALNLNYTFTGLSASTTYGQRVRAFDAAGNISAVLAAPVTTSASSATRTWTSTTTFVNVQGAGTPSMSTTPLAGIAVTAYVNDQAGNLIDTKTGLVSGSDGKPPAWTGSVGNLLTDYRVTYVKVSDSKALAIESLRCT